MNYPNGHEIDPETLRTWLEGGEPVEVIDIRPHNDFQAWHIPGSLNVDAYRAIYANNPGPLANYQPSNGSPVVAVCYVGQTSRIAAHYLRSRGIDAVSLAGGMQGWSLAWNVAEVTLPDDAARVIQVRRTGKGCLSYLVGYGEQALVIDPSLEPQVYLDLAADNGWRITKVLDTHIHADHLSRAQRLVQATGAGAYLPINERARFDFIPVQEGEMLEIGPAKLKAIATPGHTFEAMSFLLDEAALFTGDTLFLESVGRPDLKADAGESETRARLLHRSLQKIAALHADLLVLPCHTSQPVAFDQIPVAATLGQVTQKVAALGYREDKFVDWILGRIPPNPPHYETIVQLNEAGVQPLLDPTMLEAGANNCAI